MNYYNKHVYPDKMNDLTWIGSLWYAMCNVTGPFYVWMAAHIGDRSMLLFACVFGSLAMMLASITNQVTAHCYTRKGGKDNRKSDLF